MRGTERIRLEIVAYPFVPRAANTVIVWHQNNANANPDTADLCAI